jgi:choline dehydrogenase-like flavoprotein
VCVIGAGPAGISLALSIARTHDVSVTVLETGGERFEEGLQELSRTEVVGLTPDPFAEARIRALGGSTWSWGGLCTTMSPITFEHRPWVDGAWPFPQSELDPYLGQALQLAGAATPAVTASNGEGPGASEDVAVDPATLVRQTFLFSRPLRFGEAYRSDLADRRNVAVYLHSTVTRLEIEGGRVIAARGLSRGDPFEVKAGHYVLAGGGVENPRLLLTSGYEADPVGRYFMEHPRVLDRFGIRPGDTALGRLVRGVRQRRESVRFGLSEPVQRRERVLDWYADLRIGHVGQRGEAWSAARRLFVSRRPPWNESPYFQDAGGGRLRIHRGDIVSAVRRPDEVLAGLAAEITGRPGLRRYLEVWSALEQAPDAENRVTLSRERDSLGIPRPVVHWTVGRLEAQTYRRGLDILLGELERIEPGVSAGRIDPDGGWPDGIRSTWHHQGTTRMSDDPARGVVDRDARVHGLANLSIAGSSVFPVAGAKSPTITIIQLALRLADRLRAEIAAVPEISSTGAGSS